RRKAVLILAIIALRNEPLLSMVRPVNITPATVLSLYQPSTSVSRIDSERAETKVSRALLVLPTLLLLPSSKSRSRKGSLDRSVLFRSTAIIRLKEVAL